MRSYKENGLQEKTRLIIAKRAGINDLSFNIKTAKFPHEMSYLQQPDGPSKGLIVLIRKIIRAAIKVLGPNLKFPCLKYL